MKDINIADLFCGGGGTTEGARQASVEMGYQPRFTAINHNPVAIATHTANHATARHLCTSVDDLDPGKLYREGELHFMWASPECIFHSNARGGKPVNDQSRASAFCVPRWAEKLRPPVIMVENVPEFRNWGPLIRKMLPTKVLVSKPGAKKKYATKLKWQWVPDPKRKGETFLAWIRMLEALGYKVDHRVLCAAHYGDPTTRERLIVQAVRGRRKIVWPEATHAPAAELATLQAQRDLFAPKLKPYVVARDIIDWSDPGIRLTERHLHGLPPLVENTMRRLITGFMRISLPGLLEALRRGENICSAHASPVDPEMAKDYPLSFVLGQQSGGIARSVTEPIPTVATAGRIAKVSPYIISFHHSAPGRNQDRCRPTDKPLPTVDTGNRFGLVSPIIIGAGGPERAGEAQSADKPLKTVLCRNTKAVTQPYLIKLRGTTDAQIEAAHQTVDKPLPTLTSGGGHIGLSDPFVMKVNHGGGDDRRSKPVDQPLGTQTTKNGTAVVSPFVIGIDHTGGNGHQVHSVDSPVSTITTKQKHAVVTPFIIKYYGTGTSYTVDEPLDTITTKERFGLVLPLIEYNGDRYLVDFYFRMFKWRELARGQGFPEHYQFEGSTEQIVKQIGNAVPPGLAKALFKAALTQNPYV